MPWKKETNQKEPPKKTDLIWKYTDHLYYNNN